MVRNLLLADAIAILVLMSAGWLVAKRRKRLDTVDSVWGVAFALTASIVAGYEIRWRTILIAVLVDIWAVRLTSHMIERSRSHKEDPRYVTLSKKWKGNFWARAYLSIFLVQGALVWLIGLPIVTAAGKNTKAQVGFAILGAIVWLTGFIIESLADRQLRQFLRANTGVMQSGLWRYSRHPNYFGEITQWLGIGLIACGAQRGWIGLAGPCTLVIIIIFISGIPPIEKAKANNLEYQKYKRRTSPLIPWFPKH